MARKGTVLTEEAIRWSEISAEAWTSARTAAAAKAANGNPMTDDEIEARARNAQDREDIRHHLIKGGNLSANCKNMSRSELVAEVNRQLAEGLYGKGSKNGFKAVTEIRETIERRSRKRMTAKFDGHCSACQQPTHKGDTIYWSPETRLVTCESCH